MYIKQVIIEGFKSYKEQVAAEPFSPKHNCVVGANGSGKSNFFHAIRFVLSDMSTPLRAEERQAILHEGAGNQVMSAFVEIVFDNSDNRLPVDRDEVRLRRTIGLKKDEYFLDKKHITKAEVSNLLESAGFSRSNPYYVVQQGKITSLTTMKDTERLELLKEIGGTKVYEERRKESLKIMEDSKSRRNQILEVVAYIEERLKELDEEKEELQKYQKLDKERRTLEYTIFEKELADAEDKLKHVEHERAEAVKKSSTIHNKVEETREQLKEKEKELKALSKQLDALSKEKAAVERQKDEAIQNGAKVEIDVREAKATIDREKEEKVSIERELQGLGSAVDKAKKELLKVEPLHEEWKQKEQETNKGIAERERRLAILYQKQGRSTQFASQGERDKALQKEVSDLQTTIEQKRKQMSKLEKEVAALQKLVFEQSDASGASSSTIGEREGEIKKLNADHAKLHEERNGLQNQRKELWRRDNEIKSELDKLKQEVERSSQRLDSSTARDLQRGIQNVKRIVSDHHISGVHGTLLENIECDDKFNTAVEVAAGNSLMHVIVDNDEIATEIVARLNREKGGRVTFMPLSRLRNQRVDYPNSPDVVPIMEKINYKPMFRNAFAQVFSKTAICRDIEVATKTAREHNLDCVTLEGDQVNKKGAMTGGYHDTRFSRLKLIKGIRNAMEKSQALQAELKTVTASIQSVDQKITVIMGEMQKLEAQRSFVRERLEQARQDLRAASQVDQTNKAGLEKKERALVSMRDSLAQLEQSVAALEAEIGSELLGQLSRDETAELQALNPEVTELKQQLVEIRRKRMEYEARRSELESILTTNLGKRQEELQASLAAINTESSADELAAKTRDLQTIQAAIREVSQHQAEIASEVASVSASVRQLKASHEDLRSALEEDDRAIQDEGKELEALRNKRNLFQTQRENLSKKIRDLGSLPQEAYQHKYEKTSAKKLHKLLKDKNEELKKLSHVNKKALDQYVNFTEQREELRRRQDELDKGDEKIRDLIDVLDARKDEAIELTFKGVAKNFKEAFAELVPGGSASLVMQKKRRKTDEADAEDGDGEEDEATNTAEKYVGVRVKVSFSGHGETQSMKQLSGGQKTVVALALIFAIQRCDPAPFYLFDEIDAALDPQYRTAVGEMVRKQTEADPPTQFITTTFRPELVKVADKVYGVSHKNRVSVVNVINQEKALQFIEQDLVAQRA